MRKYLILLLVPFIFSCGEDPEVLGLRDVRDSLDQENITKEQEINNLIGDINDIQENLQRIKETENIIQLKAKQGDEMDESAKEQINQDIQLIYNLMMENKQKAERLERKLGNANFKISELGKLIKNLKTQIEQKDTEIAELRTKLEALNIEINELTANIDSLVQEEAEKEAIIEEKTTALNTAYYVFGTKKELLENEVITKTGGFIGIGKVEKLMKDFNKEYFTKIDITKTTSIPLSCEEAELITTHPSDTYKFEKSGETTERFIITSPKEFWSTSKYLVIQIK